MKKVISFLLLSILLITITPVITQAEDVTEQNQSPMIEEFSIPVYEDINSLIDSPKKAAVVKKVADIKFWVTPYTKQIQWTVIMKPGYLFGSFKATIHVTDLTSGKRDGYHDLKTRAGNLNVSHLIGHTMFAQIVSGKLLTNKGVAQTIPSGSALKWKAK